MFIKHSSGFYRTCFNYCRKHGQESNPPKLAESNLKSHRQELCSRLPPLK